MRHTQRIFINDTKMEPDLNRIHMFECLSGFYAYDISRMQTYKLSFQAYRILHKFLREPIPDLFENELTKKMNQNGIRIFFELVESGLIRHASERATFQREPVTFDPRIDSINLNVVEDCNCACSYCFAGEGKYGKNIGKKMSLSVAMMASDWLIDSSGDQSEIFVCFHGGEPMLNLELIEEFIRHTKKKERRFGKTTHYAIITNGTLLDRKKISRLDSLEIKIQLSVDGVGKGNDKHRKFKDGSGTWETLSRIIPMLFSNERKTTVRSTLATGNVHAYRVVTDLLNFGFNNVFLCPATGLDGGAITKEEVHILKNEIEALGQKYLEDTFLRKPAYGFQNLSRKVERMWAPKYCYSGCGAGKHYFTIGVDGDIYVCPQLVGFPKDSPYWVGNVTTGKFQVEKQMLFQRLCVTDMAECSQCWARYLCANQCVARNIRLGGDLDRSDSDFCTFELKCWEVAIAIVAELKQKGVSIFQDR